MTTKRLVALIAAIPVVLLGALVVGSVFSVWEAGLVEASHDIRER
jgi:hypothetical protein